MTAPNFINRVVIRATDVASTQKATNFVSGTANAFVDNRLGRYGAHKVDEYAGKVLDAPAAQHAAIKAENMVTNVLDHVPVVKDLASSLFEKVNSFIGKAKLRSPMIKAYKLGMDTLSMIQHETPEEEILKHTKKIIRVIKDDFGTKASTKTAVKGRETQAEVLGLILRAADNEPFADTAIRAIITMDSKGIKVPEVRLSNIFPNDASGHADLGYTNHETMPPSDLAVFFNSKANWADAAKMSQTAKKAKWQITSAPEHPIYHAVGRTMYNGAAGSERLIKSNAMPEAQRLQVQGEAQNIETPEDFMGEMFAHLMDGNDIKKEFIPLYKIYENWGGKFPKDFNISEPKAQPNTILRAAAPLEDKELRF